MSFLLNSTLKYASRWKVYTLSYRNVYNRKCAPLYILGNLETFRTHSYHSCSPSSVRRYLATAQQSSLTNFTKEDPFELAKNDLVHLYSDIKHELHCEFDELSIISNYYFDGQGKAVRPVVACLIARASNIHLNNGSELMESQKTLALIAEMIHTASLFHDDIIDISDTRRGKPSTGKIWGQRKSILAGDYVLSKSAAMLANIGCTRSNNYMSQILVDLVNGEFMQMEDKCEFNDRITHYIEKSFKKTASLLAFTCKSSVTLAGGNEKMVESAYQYGKNIGIAFQLVDDVLDFVSDQNLLGKPAAADLKLGLSTGPVLFACDEFPELNELIMRRFSNDGDIQKAYNFVLKSKGLKKTRDLAEAYCNTAVRSIEDWNDSSYKRSLSVLAQKILERNK